jgi:type III secretory pathway lipoprotein EscJ
MLSFRNWCWLVLAASAIACGYGEGQGRDEPTAQGGVEELLSGSFIPGPDEERTRREHALGGELARTIREIEGIDEARVHLSLADRSLLSRDKVASSTAAILIRTSREETAPDQERIRTLAAAAIQGLESDQVKIFVTGPSAPPVETVWVGPLEVAAGSAGAARAVLGGLLGVCILLAVGLIVAGIRLRRLRRRR